MKNNHGELQQRLQWFNFTFVLGNRKRNYAAPEEMTDQYSFIYLSKAACGETTRTHTHKHINTGTQTHTHTPNKQINKLNHKNKLANTHTDFIQSIIKRPSDRIIDSFDFLTRREDSVPAALVPLETAAGF